MDKIKAFFSNTVTKVISWIILALSSVSLIIGGANVEELNSGVVLTAGIVTAVSALVAFITTKVKK